LEYTLSLIWDAALARPGRRVVAAMVTAAPEISSSRRDNVAMVSSLFDYLPIKKYDRPPCLRQETTDGVELDPWWPAAQ
jgi:hypothetical protein